MGGRATLTPHTVNSLSFRSRVLTDILEAGIHRSIIKIHTADSQRIQLGIMMPHHLHTQTHAGTNTHTRSWLQERQGRRAEQETRLSSPQQNLTITSALRERFSQTLAGETWNYMEDRQTDRQLHLVRASSRSIISIYFSQSSKDKQV